MKTLVLAFLALTLGATASFAASTNDPAVICEAAAIKTPVTGLTGGTSNAVSVVYTAFEELSKKEVRRICLGDQGGDNEDSSEADDK